MTPRRSTLRADRSELRDATLSLQASAKPRERAERDTKCELCGRVLRGAQGLRHHLLQSHGIEE